MKSTGFLVKPHTIIPLTLAIFTVYMLTACAPDRNRRDRFARVNGTSGRTMPPKPTDGSGAGNTGPNQNLLPGTDSNGGADTNVGGGAAGGGGNPGGGNPGSGNPGPGQPADGVSASENCLATEGSLAGLADVTPAEKQLPSCGQLGVKTDDKGNIQFVSRVGTKTQLLGKQITTGEYALSGDDKKQVRVNTLSTPLAKDVKGKSDVVALDVLYLTYVLPHKVSEVDLSKSIEGALMSVEGAQPTENTAVKFAQVDSTDPNENLTIQIVNPEVIKNINFRVIIDYTLK